MSKYMTLEGIQRFWKGVEQKFIDEAEMAAQTREFIEANKINVEAISDEELDAITGYSIPVTSAADLTRAMQGRENVKIHVTEDMELPNYVYVSAGKTMVVELDGNIANQGTIGFVASGGNIVLSGNGSIEGTGVALYAQQGGTIVVNGGEYTSTSAGQCITATGEGSKVILNDGIVNAQEAGLMAFNGGELEINGGEINTVDNFGVGTNGSSGQGGNVITLKGVKINGHITSTGYVACGIYAANNDTITIDEGTEIISTNGCGICQRGGTVIVKAGAKIKTTWDGTIAEGGVGDRKKNFGADGIVFDEEGMYPTPTKPENHYPMKLVVEDGVIFDIADGYQNVHVYPADGITPDVTIG